MTLQLPIETVNQVLGYLGTRPYQEVFHLIQAIQEAAKPKDAEHAKSIRTSRTQMLKDCDWTQVADSTVNKATWATYRQALRDVPAQSGFPWTITWPDAP